MSEETAYLTAPPYVLRSPPEYSRRDAIVLTLAAYLVAASFLTLLALGLMWNGY